MCGVSPITHGSSASGNPGSSEQPPAPQGKQHFSTLPLKFHPVFVHRSFEQRLQWEWDFSCRISKAEFGIFTLLCHTEGLLHVSSKAAFPAFPDE